MNNRDKPQTADKLDDLGLDCLVTVWPRGNRVTGRRGPAPTPDEYVHFNWTRSK